MSSSDIRNLLTTALAWQASGAKVVVATVAKTWGSAPQPAGSRLIVREDGQFAGAVSGGCIEKEVISVAIELSKTAKTKLLSFGVADDTAWDVGLSCGGKIDILLQPLQTKLAEQIIAGIDQRISQVCISSDDGSDSKLIQLAQAAQDPQCENALARGQPVLTEQDNHYLLVEPLLPAWRMVIIGATRIAEHLSKLALETGFEVSVVDPRSAWIRPELFKGAKLVSDWPDEYFANETPDQSTAVITVTHDPKIDNPALIAALNANPRYIAALGSKRTHTERCEQLSQEYSLTQAKLTKIHAPAGLAIGALGAAEIAVSILAQAIQVFRNK